MAISDILVLPGDVMLLSVEKLPAYLREQMVYEEGDYVITRPGSRTTSRIIDAQTAELLKIFRTPTTIVLAIIHFSRANKLDPEQVLVDTFPMLQSFMDVSLLVEADAEQAQQIQPSLAAGDRAVYCEILRCVHIITDTEVYQARGANGEIVALKMSRPGCKSEVLHMFEQESAILKRLDNCVNPALQDAGMFHDRRYLITEWCSGVEVAVAAEELRRQQGADQRKKLLHFCSKILDAYAHLHAQGVIHADIHSRNILVASDGAIKIIDYGFACLEDSEAEGGGLQRADISYFSEPEYAQAVLVDLKVPKPSMKGEQFSLAALLYFLLTGAQYLRFSLEREEVLHQIIAGNPFPFAAYGMQSWFEVEALLAMALNKRPEKRFPSVAEFSRRLKDVIALNEQADALRTQYATDTYSPIAQELLRSVLHRLGSEGSLLASGLTMAPICSLMYGAAGIAYALYRIACVQDSAALLSLADIWSMKAIHTIKSSSAFYDEENITPEIVGHVSPYHTASGVYCVRALISHAQGDLVSRHEAIEAFIASSQGPCENIDLTFGRAGILLASAFLLDKVSQDEMLHAAPLLELGNGTMQSIWEEIKAFPAIQECSAIPYLGIAHGWAGLLYATLCWCQVSGTLLPDSIEERLQQLVACAESSGRGARWRWVIEQPYQKHIGPYMSDWCNGSTGHIHLWTLAHRIYGDKVYGKLAEQAAWHTWEESSKHGILCCGLAGQAYGLLNLYKHTGDNVWLVRAQELAQRSVLSVSGAVSHGSDLYDGLEWHRESLYYGDIGIAVLVAELARPEEACMPFFEMEA